MNVFPTPNGFIIALTYSSQSEWVKNVLAAGCELKTRGKKYQLSAPHVVRDPTRRRFPIPVRVVLRIVGADEAQAEGHTFELGCHGRRKWERLSPIRITSFRVNHGR